MKKLTALLMLLGIGLFTVGCTEADKPKTNGTKAPSTTTPKTPEKTTPPAGDDAGKTTPGGADKAGESP